MQFHVRDSEALTQLTDQIHDLWFDAQELSTRSDKSIQLDLRARPRDIHPVLRLIIHGVRSVAVNDTERVQFYDINELRYDAPLLTITTGVPIQVSLELEFLHVELHSSKTVNRGP